MLSPQGTGKIQYWHYKLLRLLKFTSDLARVALAPQLTGRSNLPPKSISGLGGEVFTNPSVLSDGKHVTIAVRQVNYRLRPDKRGIEPLPGNSENTSHTWLYQWEDGINSQPTVQLLELPEDFREYDFEDPRIFTWNSETWAIWTAGEMVGRMSWKNTMAIGRINTKGAIENIQLIPSPYGHAREKNWAPFISQGQLHFIYDFERLAVFRLEEGRISRISCTSFPVSELKDYRGSSQVIPWNDGWLCIAHRAIRIPKLLRFLPGSLYLHRIVELNLDFSPRKLSREFVLEHKGVEFCAGLAKYQDRYLISYGIDDCLARVAELRPTQIESLIGH